MSFCICGGVKHEEIVFDGRKCPLCKALEEVDDLQGRVEELEAEDD